MLDNETTQENLFESYQELLLAYLLSVMRGRARRGSRRGGRRGGGEEDRLGVVIDLTYQLHCEVCKT